MRLKTFQKQLDTDRKQPDADRKISDTVTVFDEVVEHILETRAQLHDSLALVREQLHNFFQVSGSHKISCLGLIDFHESAQLFENGSCVERGIGSRDSAAVPS